MMQAALAKLQGQVADHWQAYEAHTHSYDKASLGWTNVPVNSAGDLATLVHSWTSEPRDTSPPHAAR